MAKTGDTGSTEIVISKESDGFPPPVVITLIQTIFLCMLGNNPYLCLYIVHLLNCLCTQARVQYIHVYDMVYVNDIFYNWDKN